MKKIHCRAVGYSLREDYDAETNGKDRPLTAYVDIELPNTWRGNSTARVSLTGRKLAALLQFMDDLAIETLTENLTRDDDVLIGGINAMTPEQKAELDAMVERRVNRELDARVKEAITKHEAERIDPAKAMTIGETPSF